MALVKVRNLNTIPFEVTWQEKRISIPSGDFIEMDWEDANVFIKTPFKSIKRDGMGRDLPEGKQALRIERDGDVTKYQQTTAAHCPVCRVQLQSWEALDGHTAAMHSDRILQDEEYQKFVEQKKGSQNAGTAKQPVKSA